MVDGPPDDLSRTSDKITRRPQHGLIGHYGEGKGKVVVLVER